MPRERAPVARKSPDGCTEGFSMARHLTEVRSKCKASRGGALGVKEPPGFLQPGTAGALREPRRGADVVDQFFQPLDAGVVIAQPGQQLGVFVLGLEVTVAGEKLLVELAGLGELT